MLSGVDPRVSELLVHSAFSRAGWPIADRCKLPPFGHRATMAFIRA